MLLSLQPTAPLFFKLLLPNSPFFHTTTAEQKSYSTSSSTSLLTLCHKTLTPQHLTPSSTIAHTFPWLENPKFIFPWPQIYPYSSNPSWK
ncbi:hypothetical protein M6B38_292130 [Iris pallida]|uniref:Uncharacterized protein n=1 Tax=Iris pallida TaxID=29817 RepID=A0AAX6HTF9_IRIPA|nr:hypothetical protein M6B38_292130 [Iris pallida]